MQAPVALTFCAVAFWKKGWPSAPIPQTRTVRSRVERGAGAEADMSYRASFLRIPYTIPVNINFIILGGPVCEGYDSTQKLPSVRRGQRTPRFQEHSVRSQVLV